MKVVIGGPPHSGKSTFTAGLIERVRERKRGRSFNIAFTWLTLDITDNSLGYLLDRTGETPRKNEEIEWSEETARPRGALFESRDEQLVIADAPGRITPELDIVMEPADAMIIVASREKEDKISDWRERAEELDIEVFAIFKTVLNDGVEPYWDPDDPDTSEGVLRSIGRDDFRSQRLGAYDDTTSRILRQLSIRLLKRAVQDEKRKSD